MEKDLLKRIEAIEKRNKKVEGDKAWETSWFRKILIMIATYFFAFLYLKIADTTNPYFGVVVPVAVFFLSTWSLKYIKIWWLRQKEGNNSEKEL